MKPKQKMILPCGCEPPFVLCQRAQELFMQETAARDAYVDTARDNQAALAAARANYMAARAAFDAHIEPPQKEQQGEQ